MLLDVHAYEVHLPRPRLCTRLQCFPLLSYRPSCTLTRPTVIPSTFHRSLRALCSLRSVEFHTSFPYFLFPFNRVSYCGILFASRRRINVVFVPRSRSLIIYMYILNTGHLDCFYTQLVQILRVLASTLTFTLYFNDAHRFVLLGGQLK